MTTVFLDESGDLGFDFSKPRTSRYFLITILVCDDDKMMNRLVKKIFRGFSAVEIKHHHGTLHAYSENDHTRRKLLSLLCKEDVSILVIYLEKRRVPTALQDKKHIIYNYIVSALLGKLVEHGIVSTKELVRVVASQRETSAVLNSNFKAYLTSNAVKQHGIKLNVEIKPVSAEKGLQVVDCVSWSIFRKYEYGDPTYATLVDGRIVEESGINA